MADSPDRSGDVEPAPVKSMSEKQLVEEVIALRARSRIQGVFLRMAVFCLGYFASMFIYWNSWEMGVVFGVVAVVGELILEHLAVGRDRAAHGLE